MSVVYSSNFDADTVGALPTGWVNQVGSWTVQSAHAVSGNALQGTAANDVATYNSTTATADMELLYQLKTWNNGGLYPIPAPVLRSNSGYTNAYIIVFTLSGTSITNAKLYKRISGTNSLVSDHAITAVNFTVGDVLSIRARIVGSAISLTIWNTTTGSEPGSVSTSWTDTSVTAAGYGGVYCAGTAGAAVDVFSFDDTSSGATVPGAPTIGTATAGNASASIAFTPPASNGGSAITGYTVTSTPGSFTGAGTSSPIAVSGLTNGTSYTFRVHATNAIGNSAESAASNSVTPAAPATFDETKVLFSPYTWNVSASLAKAISAGAYFKTQFTGASCTLHFDVSTLTGNFPRIAYRVDGLAWVTSTLLAASMAVSMPSETAAYPKHLLEVVVTTTSEASNRWDGVSNVVALTGITLAGGGVLSKPTAKPLSGIFFGDSITEGINTIGNSGDATTRSTALQCWSLEAARLVGAEVGNVGFGGQGLSVTGAGSIPIFGSTYGYLYSGVARSFAIEPDFIVINQGTNDGATNITAAFTAALSGLLAATTLCEIIVLRPFGGTTQAANIQAAIAACTDPARVHYIDTAGWYNTANSYDTTHPNGFENLSNLAYRVASEINAIVHPLRGTRTARTVTVTLKDRNGAPVTSIVGLKWAFFDEITPDLMTVVADQGTDGVFDGSGGLSITVHTTLPSGGTGWLIATNSDGTTTQSPVHKAFSGPVAVT